MDVDHLEKILFDTFEEVVFGWYLVFG
jgi:hypothetical protein